MMPGMDVRIWGVKHEDLYRALSVAENFAMQHPGRVGIGNCAVYAPEGQNALFAYRTKGGQIVVRATDPDLS